MELVRRFFAAVGREDVPAALSYLDPQLEWIPHRAATEGSYIGHQGFERFVADTNATFDKFEPRLEFRDLGDEVLAWGTIATSAKSSGIELEFPAGGLFGLRGGKIIRWQDFGSKDEALRAAAAQD